jgi:thiamine-monophosphate kinase
VSEQKHTTLGSGGEFDIIRRMLERWGPRAKNIGDDAAVITSVGEGELIVSTDTSTENVHFRREWLSAQEIGYRATASALSDLAAMAATPLGILVAMGIPEEWRPSIDQIADGIGDAAASVDAPIIGGDMSRSTELSLTITVLGTAPAPLLRSGAREGDLVYVTGRFGGSGKALDAFLTGKPVDREARARFAHPKPRIGEAQWLAANGASAAIDISDGLSPDLAHVAAASGVSLVINVDDIPVIPAVTPLEALVSGEEYELAITSRSLLDGDEFSRLFDLELTLIGNVARGDPGVRFVSKDGEIKAGKGYLHFG